MPKRETKYSAEWEKTRSWLKRGDTPYSARCSLCNKQFSISGGGASQVVSHEKSQSHRKATPSKTQSLLSILPTGHMTHTHRGAEILTPVMQALKAEIIETLHKTEYNHSFSSAEKDGERYCLMFPGHSATEKYSCTFTTKSAYLLQYGISEILKSEQIQDIKDVPYTSKCDEIATSQVLKHYDGYLYYWSPMYEKIVNPYTGSLFMGHCGAANLVHDFYEIVQPLDAKGVHLLHLVLMALKIRRSLKRICKPYFMRKRTHQSCS